MWILSNGKKNFVLIFGNIFSFRGYNWFWIFLVGPHVGAILGVFIFHFVLLETNQTAKVDGKMNNSQLPIVDYEYEVANELDSKPQANTSKTSERRIQNNSEEYVDIASPI